MAESIHPAAAHHLASFITPPGRNGLLMVVMGVVLGLSVLGFGIFFFRLHSLPEQLAHKSHKLQFEIVGALCLISSVHAHHIFWVAGLLLANGRLADFGTSLNRIAGSTEKLAGLQPGEGTNQRNRRKQSRPARRANRRWTRQAGKSTARARHRKPRLRSARS